MRKRATPKSKQRTAKRRAKIKAATLQATRAPGRHKYNATPTMVDGRRFASAREAHRYKQLRLLEEAGKIEELRCQVSFPLTMKVRYVADFCYIDPKTGMEVVEDVKGYKTDVYKRKKKLMAEQHGIDIVET